MDSKINELLTKEDLFRPVYIPGIDREAAGPVLSALAFKYIEERLDRKENILICDVNELGIGDGSESNAILVFMSNIVTLENGGRKVDVKIHKCSTPVFDPATTKLNEVATMAFSIFHQEIDGKIKMDAKAYFGMLGSDLVEIPIPDSFTEEGIEEEDNKEEEAEEAKEEEN